MPDTDVDPRMLDLQKMGKRQLQNLCARLRIQIGILEAVRDSYRNGANMDSEINTQELDDCSAAAVLADSRLVETRPDGTRVFYSPTLAKLYARFAPDGIASEPHEPHITPQLVVLDAESV